MSAMSHMLYIPDVALEKIFSFLSFDEIARNREVCTRFNEIGGKLLSRGFMQIERRHSAIYKKVKSMLPRRESERRTHPLARHCDILSAVETRISMLNMTYMKYIDNNMCCFIPGKVLDEISRILTLVEKSGPPPRTHELLQELRDISSMAMEHFDENILPNLKQQLDRNPVLSFGPSQSKSTRFVIVQHTISDEIHKIKKQNKSNKQRIAVLSQHMLKLFKKIKRQSIRLKSQSLRIREQERKIQEQAMKIQEQESSVADLKKHMDEWDQKFSDLTSELIRAREDLLSKNFTPKQQTSTYTHTLSPPRLYRSNIKPRMAQILSPRTYGSLQFELERKRKNSLCDDQVPNKLSRPLTTEDEIHNKINENITSNISSSINKDDNYMKNYSTSKESNKESNDGKSLPFTNELSMFLSSSLESFLKTPLASIKSRKRKMPEEIDLK